MAEIVINKPRTQETLMKLVSWNVNGIRAVLKKGFVKFLENEKPDILSLQEIKGSAQVNVPYIQHWNTAKKKGYSGTALFCTRKPKSVDCGLMGDDEGRVICADFGEFYLVNVYTPNAQRGLTRLDYRQEWDRKFLTALMRLEKKKSVVVCGDLNVAHTDIDLARPKQNQKNAGFTLEEREGFQRYIDSGMIDTFREFVKEGGHYTWWSYMMNARAKDIGWRIDYFLVSPALRSRLGEAFILKDVMGSDHCPVGIVLDA